ncbi:hypothetical protein BKA59DRAFT_478182 [Fusarium tricinctum]|uniref:Uncharacterized protein n=1 Tax=Fusarium tricinctum TaxID=61284 RepID=A0A8K0RVF9_9HYPO|nr:hypothetical protein BKA59DRAFT_488922 [Fusarium tricinctum]KAH7246582.1 hypothetical protein BKA59DRAFT_478182 [Fusarium tricinctum]
MNLRRDLRFDPFSEEARQLDKQGPPLPDIDWSDPHAFLTAMGGPMPELPSPDKVRQQAAGYSSKIFTSYDLLKGILERHEATIQKRWTKKTRQQRLQILLKAWPAIPASHRPDFEAFRKEPKEEREKGTKFKDHFMWPYVNQEDLSQSKLMLLLINARGRRPPPAFAAADNDAMHLGKVTKALTPVFLNENTMILHGATRAEEYGKLLDWDSHPDAFDWMHTRKQFLPGEGLLILEAQARLMSFLIDCCRQILHEIPEENITSDVYPVQPEPQLKTDSDASGFPSLAVMATEAPYRLPAKLDFDRLSSLLEARKLAAEDHVWSLREDPAYFADQFREIQDHRQEMIPDTQGKPHPATQKLRENTLWARVTFGMLMDAYASLETLTALHRQAQNLGHLQKKFEKKIQATNELPEEYMVALLRFKYYLEQASKAPLEKLKVSVTASPPMRKFFVREPPPDPNTTKILIRTRPGVNMDKAETELIWLLRTLWEDDYALFLARPPIVVDELERLLQAEPKADALISAHVAKIIGELAILTQCQKQLELYQPWAQQFDMASADHVDGFEKEFTALQKPMTQLHGAFLQKHLDSAARVGEPSGGKFTYPYGKRRTKETVDALRQAEANLDMFWAKVDDVTKARVMDFEGTALYRLLSQPRILRRTAQWVEPAKKSERVEPSLEKDIWALNQPMSNLFLGQSEKMGQDPSSRSVQSKTKVKTKGKASQVPSDAVDAQPANATNIESVDNQPTFAVDARVLKVFRTLFFNPEVTSTPGSVPWHDFLYSMASTGFRIEKLYGSVWQFSPTSLDVERSIHFHEPHPKGKIPFEVARRHGRRLTRAYGWHGGMFVLKEKE